MPDSRRNNRIQIPHIDVQFRGDVRLEQLDVWREDRLIQTESGQVYIVLDFAIEERVDHAQAEKPEHLQDWRSTGRALIEVQRIDSGTGTGLANPTFKEIAGEEGAITTWNGWQLQPCSPRRPPAEQSPEPVDVDLDDNPASTTCLMCGAPAVYWEFDGSGRCTSHVGESPELPRCDGSGLLVEVERMTGVVDDGGEPVPDTYHCPVCHQVMTPGIEWPLAPEHSIQGDGQ